MREFQEGEVKIEKSGSHKDIHGKGNEKKTSIHESPCVTHFHFSSFFNKEKRLPSDNIQSVFSDSVLWDLSQWTNSASASASCFLVIQDWE